MPYYAYRHIYVRTCTISRYLYYVCSYYNYRTLWALLHLLPKPCVTAVVVRWWVCNL